MTEKELKKIRSIYHAFREHRTFLKEGIARNHTIVEQPVFEGLRQDVEEIERVVPGLLPSLDPSDSLWRGAMTGSDGHRSEVLVAYLNRAISRLEAELNSDQAQPVTQVRTFTFVGDPAIRAVVERDYTEIQRAFVAECWKSVIILSGGAIEALLTDTLKNDLTAARAAKNAPRQHRSDPTRWNLSELIEVAVELKKVTEGVEKLSHSVREYRNLVHPGLEVRSGLTLAQEEARIAVEILHLVHRDLSP